MVQKIGKNSRKDLLREPSTLWDLNVGGKFSLVMEEGQVRP